VPASTESHCGESSIPPVSRSLALGNLLRGWLGRENHLFPYRVALLCVVNAIMLEKHAVRRRGKP